MRITRREFLVSSAALALTRGNLAAAPAMGLFENAKGRAAPFLLCRRLYLDICGRLPTPEETQDFVHSTDPERLSKTVDTLLASEDFADYWSMRWCDILRVKSEFPINLWPNAVYVYHRRIRAAIANDEPWDHFARALLGGLGSNFRVPEANFLRAVAQRTPKGLSEAASLTFLMKKTSKYERYFSRVAWKSTREWKEEIVYLKDGPDGDTPTAFADLLCGPLANRFHAAVPERVHAWVFGSLPDERRRDKWIRAFEKGGLRLKPLLRRVFTSSAYQAGPLTGGFPARRLDAEVLDDVLCSLMNADHNFSSIAPEPFTFLPKRRRSVLIEDGSISSPFLLLFGRPARDTGELKERNNAITAKQRLYLYNSGKLAAGLNQLVSTDAFKALSREEKLSNLYLRFLSRLPTSAEKVLLNREYRVPPRDVAWLLMNSREFLYRI